MALERTAGARGRARAGLLVQVALSVDESVASVAVDIAAAGRVAGRLAGVGDLGAVVVCDKRQKSLTGNRDVPTQHSLRLVRLDLACRCASENMRSGVGGPARSRFGAALTRQKKSERIVKASMVGGTGVGDEERERRRREEAEADSRSERRELSVGRDERSPLRHS